MTNELEPLDADMLSLLDAAKPIADLEPTAKAAILAAVEARVGLPPGPGGGGGGGGGQGTGGPGAGGAGVGLAGARAIVAIAGTFALGIVVGVAGSSLRSAPEPAPASGVPSAIAASTPPQRETPSAAPEVPAVEVGSLPSAAHGSSGAGVRTASPETVEAPTPSSRGLGAERSLLDIARAALARGEAAEALVAVDRHAREYPDGALVEEREALAIKALVAQGRRDEARARARRFEQRFPNGLMLRAVKGAVGDP